MDISPIRIWESITYKKEAIWQKLNFKAIKYILIGYKLNQYRILNSRTGKIAWARDLNIVKDIPNKTKRKDLKISLKASIGPQKTIY